MLGLLLCTWRLHVDVDGNMTAIVLELDGKVTSTGKW